MLSYAALRRLRRLHVNDWTYVQLFNCSTVQLLNC